MKISFEKLSQFQFVADAYAKRIEGQNKLTYAIWRVAAAVASLVKQYNQEAEDIAVEFASVNKQGHIVTDEYGRYVYTKEDQKKRIAKVRELQSEEKYELKEYFATEIPDDLTPLEIETFTGIVIAPEKVSDATDKTTRSSE